jgi:hypothetical protein
MHGGYLVALILAVLTYYPISTFLFPNFQFADVSLDLKYETLNPKPLVLNF